MNLAQDLACVVTTDVAADLQNFRSHIPPLWIDEALEATGRATLRRRRLPAEHVLWLVIGMGMMGGRPIADVVSTLGLSLPDAKRSEVAPSAVVAARQRLGEEPVAYLFHRTAEKWAYESAGAHRWRGLELFGIDGTTMRAADSKENRRYFGLVNCGNRGESGYPIVCIAALMALRSHLLVDVCFGPFKKGEIKCAEGLWSKIPNGSLTLLDRAYLSPLVLVPLQREGANRNWLTRAKKNTRWRIVKRLGSKDALVELTTSEHARAKDPSLPKTWLARAINYRIKGHKPGWLLTSLVEPDLYPRQEIIKLYHERWELELGFDEMKTEMRKTEFCLRSKTLAGTRQELWGIFLAYNLVRLEMERVANLAGAEPTEISFATSLRLITDAWMLCAAVPDALLVILSRLQTSMRRILLPPRRSHRVYPRAVKVKMSCYPRKRRPPSRSARQPTKRPSPLHPPRPRSSHAARLGVLK